MKLGSICHVFGTRRFAVPECDTTLRTQPGHLLVSLRASSQLVTVPISRMRLYNETHPSSFLIDNLVRAARCTLLRVIPDHNCDLAWDRLYTGYNDTP